MITINYGKEALSELGCNVATGVVVDRLIKEKYKGVYFINVFTLYRNFIGCLEGNADEKMMMFKSRLRLKKVKELFIKDTNAFLSACITNGIDVTIYELDYGRINATFKNFRNTLDYKGLKYFVVGTQKDAADELKTNVAGVYKKMGISLPHVKGMLITTHIGLDLLPLASYRDVNIIESHTAEIKNRLKWYSKLGKFGKNDMSIIPFNELSYRIFGDGEFVKPSAISTRKIIFTAAKKLRWYQGLKSRDVLQGITKEDKALGSSIKKTFKLLF